MTRDDELKYLKMQLKHGEYDGLDIMQAWLAIDELLRTASMARKERLMYTRMQTLDINALDENVGA